MSLVGWDPKSVGRRPLEVEEGQETEASAASKLLTAKCLKKRSDLGLGPGSRDEPALSHM